jgi:glycine/D-amino acid oxidase-like deaminating enzyme
MGLSKSDPIIIVGAGSFGLSAALHLSQRGYTDILVFGKDNYAPSGDLSIVVGLRNNQISGNSG